MDKQRRKGRTKSLKLMYLLAGILICVVILVGVLILKDKDKTNMESDRTDGLHTEEEGDYDIETSYGNLVFPKKWEKYVRTKVSKKKGIETVQFWAKLEGKKKVHVFDIIFGGEGYKIGTIKDDKDEEIVVCIESYSYDLDNSWSDEEKNILYTIDHDINYLLEHLNELDNFTPVE